MKKSILLSIVFAFIFSLGVLLLPMGFALDNSPADRIGKIYEIGVSSFATVDTYISTSHNTYGTYTNEISKGNVYFFIATPPTQLNYAFYNYAACWYDSGGYSCPTDTLISKSKYWQIVKLSEEFDENHYALLAVEYEEPEYSLSCDKSVIGKNETSNCKIGVESTANISRVSFKIDHDAYSIKDEQADEKFTLEKANDIYNLIAKSGDNTGKTDLMRFVLSNDTGVENANTNNIKIKDLSYEDALKTANVEDLVTTLSSTDNPKTYSQILLIGIVVSFVIVSIILLANNYSKKKTKILIDKNE